MNFIEKETPRKLRGGYYTDAQIARFLTQWVLETKPSRVLEPSCGDGVFFEALARMRPRFLESAVGFEIEPLEAAKATKRAKLLNGTTVSIHAADFLDWSLTKLWQPPSFDGVLGNPPFIRYQYLDERLQARAEKIFAHFDLHFTKHTNAWVPFVLASVALLRPGGRLAMVIPTEILHILHAQSLRTFLGSNCSKILVIDPEELWFDQTLQGVVLLLAEKTHASNRTGHGLAVIPARSRAFLERPARFYFEASEFANGDCLSGKWTRALLTPTERGVLDSLAEHPEVRRFSKVAAVDVGIVTGANKFFLVDNETVSRFGLGSFAHPMFGRSEHCPGVIYDERQHVENGRKGNPTNFIWITRPKSTLPGKVLEYLELGEKEKLHTRYKCRVREPWYGVPSVYATSVCMLKRASDTPRLILNKLGAYTTDTAYRISPKQVAADKLVYCFLNALTALSAEVEGRHYGGGVIELVPSEIEKLVVPLPRGLRPHLYELDGLVRRENAAAVLEQQSQRVLGELGVKRAEQEQLLGAWVRLKNRRQRITAGLPPAEAAP